MDEQGPPSAGPPFSTVLGGPPPASLEAFRVPHGERYGTEGAAYWVARRNPLARSRA